MTPLIAIAYMLAGCVFGYSVAAWRDHEPGAGRYAMLAVAVVLVAWQVAHP